MTPLPPQIQQLLEQLREIAGVELRQLDGSEPTPHQLRHAYAIATTQPAPKPEQPKSAKLRLVS